MNLGDLVFFFLLLLIGWEFLDEDFENLKFLCEGMVLVSYFEIVICLWEFFFELIYCCDFSDENKDLFFFLLFYIGWYDFRNCFFGVESKLLFIIV